MYRSKQSRTGETDTICKADCIGTKFKQTLVFYKEFDLFEKKKCDFTEDMSGKRGDHRNGYRVQNRETNYRHRRCAF